MNACCIITPHPFWLEALGCGTLMRSRHRLLQTLFDEVYVIFITSSEQTCPLPGLTIRTKKSISKSQTSAIAEYVAKNKIQYCHFSYISNSHITAELPCKTGVEIHDVLHLREKNFKKFGFVPPVSMTKDQEVAMLKRFDFILSISTTEVNYLESVGLPCFYLPPTSDFNPLPYINTSANIGIIGSSAAPNIDGLQQILDHATFTSKLIISGSLASSEPAKRIHADQKICQGVIQNVATHYSKMNVSIAPIRFGAGLKIKVLESLAFGRPSISTRHSANGFPSGIESVNIIQDNIAAWDDGLVAAAQNISQNQIKEYFMEHFSLERAQKAMQFIVG